VTAPRACNSSARQKDKSRNEKKRTSNFLDTDCVVIRARHLADLSSSIAGCPTLLRSERDSRARRRMREKNRIGYPFFLFRLRFLDTLSVLKRDGRAEKNPHAENKTERKNRTDVEEKKRCKKCSKGYRPEVIHTRYRLTVEGSGNVQK